MDFYEKVIDLCKQNGVSRSKMADSIGISRSTPKDWEGGKTKPQYATIKKIADFFSVSVEYLTENDSPEQNTTPQTVQDNHGIIGNANAPVTIMNGDNPLTEQETELLNLFRKLSVLKQSQLIVKAAEMLDNERKD